MTTWQLDPTGRFPQALADYLARLRFAGTISTQLEAQLAGWRWLVENGFVYHNVGHARCTGQFGFVDCSGGEVLTRNAANVNRETDASSFYYARLCHDLPRPQWVTDKFGPGRGYGITREQANATPGAWKFHGRAEGTDYSDNGHIAEKYWISREGDPHAGPNVSVEAMSHAAGVGFSTFIDDRDTYYAIQPYLTCYQQLWTPSAPTFRMEQTMLIQTHHYTPTGAQAAPCDSGAGNDATISIAADGRSLECRDDASIANDQPVPGHPKTGPGSLRRFSFPGNPIPAGVQIKAIERRPPDAEDPRVTGVALLTNGDTRRFHLS